MRRKGRTGAALLLAAWSFLGSPASVGGAQADPGSQAANPPPAVAAQPSRAEAIASYFGRPVSEVNDLRAQGYGYAEIVKILVIVQMSGRSLPELMARHQRGYGWGTISRELGLNLAAVKRKVDAVRRKLRIVAAKRAAAGAGGAP